MSKADVIRYMTLTIEGQRGPLTKGKVVFDNVKLTFDGDTFELKQAEVIDAKPIHEPQYVKKTTEFHAFLHNMSKLSTRS